MYILEGNIGAGKSTLLNKIRAANDMIEVVMEPVNAWHKQESGQSLLSQFYSDIPRWAFSLESYAMACRVKEHLREQQHTHPYRLFERSIYSGHYCFAHNSYQSGGMTPIEWDIYKQWFALLMKGKCKLPTGFIYLKANPETCLQRIQKRNRPGEENITLQYLQNIDKAHELFLIEKKGLTPELQMIPVLTLDGNKPFESSEILFNQYYDQIEEFMHMTHLSSSELDLESPIDATAS